MLHTQRFVLALLALLVPSVLFACLWDYDTITMERARFPTTLELITGKFLRHSPEFYQWRIDDRLERLKTEPNNIALLDDLAVAYDKTGQNAKAIETALQTEEQHPGRYETASNLATFYMHADQWEEGIKWVDRALEINPDAHFGREKYQKLLAEYVLERRKETGTGLPLSEITKQELLPDQDPYPNSIHATKTFADFIDPRGEYRQEPVPPEVIEPAMKGLLGMMRFANHRSPILLEALASLLTQNPAFGSDDNGDGKLLACRAYLRASYEVNDQAAKDAYRDLAFHALTGQIGEDLKPVEDQFRQELRDADRWYADLHAKELLWIKTGVNPETEFDKLYAADPMVTDYEDIERRQRRLVSQLILWGVLSGFSITAIFVLRLRNAWRKDRSAG